MAKIVTVYNLTDHPYSRKMCGFKVPKPIKIGGVEIPAGSSRPIRESVLDKKKADALINSGAVAIGEVPSWYLESKRPSVSAEISLQDLRGLSRDPVITHAAPAIVEIVAEESPKGKKSKKADE